MGTHVLQECGLGSEDQLGSGVCLPDFSDHVLRSGSQESLLGRHLCLGEPCIYARAYHTDQYAFLPLSTVIADTENVIKSMVNTALWLKAAEEKTKDSQRKRISSSSKPSSQRAIPAEKQAKVVKPRFKYSVVDYWAGKRSHIKGPLYVDKINDTYGILNMDAQRYVAIPIYKDIRISDDKSEAELILKDGEVESVIKL